jgi:uncharacterized protein
VIAVKPAPLAQSPVSELPFRSLSPYLRARFGREVHRVALDAGSTCPNRDGSKGFGGCVYCDVDGSGNAELKSGFQLAEQLERGIERVLRRDPNSGVIAYFQSYSNTYVERSRLKEVLQVVEPYLKDRVCAVSIATRPDTLPAEALELLSELAQRVPVWIELGLEAADDALLAKIKRFHTVQDFSSAVERSQAAGLEVIGHAILGLPGDGREGARRTARLFAETGVDGVKVHNLMVLRRTQLEQWYRQGAVAVLDTETYVDWLADFIERLAPHQILHRLSGDAPADERIAPTRQVHASEIRMRLLAELEGRKSRQGCRLGERSQPVP